ncbi:hypothetical protein TELCIR_11668 [Teladorsagia circumcincta]|uniref:Acyl-CoA desaturase n=1 Tax=Teladorsagia circumcincta TaxID=45464 RepID=A0A2G9U8L0_TELCI|nr:hypothetical protein TELCIR_11668 [Teladorsagia circumcincta]
MASRGGQRAAGTDGTDFQHRQRIAAHYQESAQYKFILKWFFAPHLLILIFMWAKGVFPMVIIWYVFFAVALQIHGFAMYFSYHLAAAWTPMKRD